MCENISVYPAYRMICSNLRAIMFVLWCTVATTTAGAGELEAVVVVYRHGDRSPLHIYKHDPHGVQNWSKGLGELTNTGILQQYNFGVWLRKRYDKFLPKIYNVTDIRVESSNIDRCLMSAYANLAGLYTPQGEDVWSKRLQWRPIPVHTKPEDQDVVLVTSKMLCPKYAALYTNLWNTEYFKAWQSAHAEIFDYVSSHTGENISTLVDFCKVYDTLLIEELYGLELPHWTKKVYPEEMKTLNEFKWEMYTYTSEMARLISGPLIHRITSHLEHTTKRQRFLMLSTHDNLVVALLGGLKLVKAHQPSYTATVIFELWNKEGNRHVKIYYKQLATDVAPLNLPSCQHDCPLEKFQQIVSPLRVDAEDWKRECVGKEQKS